MRFRQTTCLGFLLAVLLCGAATADPQAPENALVAFPDGEAPEAGWPCIVLLHGYGTNKEDFSDVIEILAQRDVASFTVDAPVSIGDGRRSWSRDSAASYATLQPTFEFIRNHAHLDETRVFAGGFSQGGFHSLLIAKAHPDEIAGLMIISPGGGSTLPAGWEGENLEQPLYMLYGTEEGSGIRGLVDRAAKEWRDADQRVRIEDHPGGHHFPGDWETVLGNAMDWLLEEPE